jgi:hypothetical protein
VVRCTNKLADGLHVWLGFGMGTFKSHPTKNQAFHYGHQRQEGADVVLLIIREDGRLDQRGESDKSGEYSNPCFMMAHTFGDMMMVPRYATIAPSEAGSSVASCFIHL